MIKNAFCTIITQSHLPYALTLFQSIRKFNRKMELNVLIVNMDDDISQYNIPDGMILYKNEDLITIPYAQEISEKYLKKGKIDQYRWSMKSVFLLYLATNRQLSNAIYLDSDIYFFGEYQFLFELLDSYNVILTPHWRSLDATIDQKDFANNYKDGFYNGGFVGVNGQSKDLLLWWAKMCHFKCERKPSKGFYDDQGYLSMFPLVEEKVKIIHHRGCNVASWNNIENKRIYIDGQCLINGHYPIVFIHFSSKIFDRALSGHDDSLNEYVIIYLRHLLENGVQLNNKLSKWLKKNENP